jgi:hypothetical protein
MRSRVGVAILAEYALRPLGNPPNRSQPAWHSATLAAEKRAHVGQDGVAHVEYHLKWLESKYSHGETPRKPFSVRQTPQNLGNGFSAEFHRAIGHEEMDRRVGVPDVEIRMERQQRIRVVANRLYDEARLTQTALCRPLHPMPNAATDSAFVIEQQDTQRRPSPVRNSSPQYLERSCSCMEVSFLFAVRGENLRITSPA